MAIQTEPTRIQIPFADSGTKNVIPDTNSTPSASQAASWTDGFPAQCSLPLSAGGIPPARADFNGILNAMTQSERFTQEGGVWEWDATVDYGSNRVVLGSDGLLYWSVAQSGPNVGGAQDPTADASHTYWTSPTVPTMPVTDNSNATPSTAWVSSKINSWYTDNAYHTDYYLDPAGSDSNDGLSAATPKKTWAGLISALNSIYFNNRIPKIHFAAGTYSEAISTPSIGFTASLIGPSSGYATFSLINAASENSSLLISGRFQLTGNSYTCFAASRGAAVSLSGAVIDISGASGYAAFVLDSNALITNNSGTTTTITFSGANSFTKATIALSNGARFVSLGTMSVSVASGGSVSGSRYDVVRGSGISGFGSPTLMPGSSNGNTDSTSYYF